MQMTSTLCGMEQYYNLKKQSLFDDIRLPNGVDKQTLVNTILIESGEFETIYTNGDFLRLAIKTWFERKYNMLDRWIKAINTDYKPLENYNRTERWTDKSNGTTSNESNKNSKSDNSGNSSDETSNTSSKSSEVTVSSTINSTYTNDETVDNTSSGSNSLGAQTNSEEKKISAFNSDSYSPSERNESSLGSKTDTTSSTGKTTTKGKVIKSDGSSITGNSSDATTDTGTSSSTFSNTSTTVDKLTDSGTSNSTSEHVGEMYGNIGVTTSQQMLESEMTLWGKIDIYRDTAEMFVQDFCIMVY